MKQQKESSKQIPYFVILHADHSEKNALLQLISFLSHVYWDLSQLLILIHAVST